MKCNKGFVVADAMKNHGEVVEDKVLGCFLILCLHHRVYSDDGCGCRLGHIVDADT